MEAMEPKNKMTKENQQNIIIAYFGALTPFDSSSDLRLKVRLVISFWFYWFSHVYKDFYLLFIIILPFYVLLTVRYRHEMLKESNLAC